MNRSKKNSLEVSKWKKRLWILFWIVWFFMPFSYGWFYSNQIECKYCFREVFIHHLAVFGYWVLGGFIYSFSKPSKGALTLDPDAEHSNTGNMLGTQEDVIFKFIIGSALVSGFQFFTTYQF